MQIGTFSRIGPGGEGGGGGGGGAKEEEARISITQAIDCRLPSSKNQDEKCNKKTSRLRMQNAVLTIVLFYNYFLIPNASFLNIRKK
jgi:hypothetical protein